MASYYNLAISKNGRQATIAFHIPIPVENNSSGIPLRTALSQFIKPTNESGVFVDFQSRVPFLAPGELAKLQAGEMYEVVKQLSFLAADTNGQKQQRGDDEFTSLSVSTLNSIRAVLKFWGNERNII